MQNPSKKQSPLESPVKRATSVNDPDFVNNLGYFPYNLSHTEVLAPLYGQITPCFHLITTLGDRHVLSGDTKTILNQINGNFLNTVNQYRDSFFVSMRTMFPNNWDKLIPNPVKGDDIPHSARPIVPLMWFFSSFVYSTDHVDYVLLSDDSISFTTNRNYYIPLNQVLNLSSIENFSNGNSFYYHLNNATYLAYILSRGQLLDYLGFQFDEPNLKSYQDSFQYLIDRFFDTYWHFIDTYNGFVERDNESYAPDFYFSRTPIPDNGVVSAELPRGDELGYFQGFPQTLSDFRSSISDAIEAGDMIGLFFGYDFGVSAFTDGQIDILQEAWGAFLHAWQDFYIAVLNIFSSVPAGTPSQIDTMENPFADGRSLNISKLLAYQLSVAEFFTNDSVDNIYTSELYMQLLRGVMYPSVDGVTQEPTFDYNGVPTEYDYLSYGGFYHALLNPTRTNRWSRVLKVCSLLFVLRRSLRYGDKFTTARTRMLAIGNLSIPVGDDGLSVNPVDVTANLVAQRFLNAANRIGNKPLAYYASMWGIVPSDEAAKPRYVSHQMIELQSQITNNTSGNQGAQTTNLVGYSDNGGFDVFIDDFGILLSVLSYDVLPIYHSGIDAENYLSDRFEFFNPMMQNIGDEPIRASELIGNYHRHDDVFGWTVRDSAYKYKLSKAHGVLSWQLPGYLLKFKLSSFYSPQLGGNEDLHIDPDFIRDKPALLDSVVPQMTGVSPGSYFHFIVSCQNNVRSARLIQKAPPVLF